MIWRISIDIGRPAVRRTIVIVILSGLMLPSMAQRSMGQMPAGPGPWQGPPPGMQPPPWGMQPPPPGMQPPPWGMQPPPPGMQPPPWGMQPPPPGMQPPPWGMQPPPGHAASSLGNATATSRDAAAAVGNATTASRHAAAALGNATAERNARAAGTAGPSGRWAVPDAVEGKNDIAATASARVAAGAPPGPPPNADRTAEPPLPDFPPPGPDRAAPRPAPNPFEGVPGKSALPLGPPGGNPAAPPPAPTTSLPLTPLQTSPDPSCPSGNCPKGQMPQWWPFSHNHPAETVYEGTPYPTPTEDCYPEGGLHVSGPGRLLRQCRLTKLQLRAYYSPRRQDPGLRH